MAPTHENFTAPAPNQFEKPINKKFQVMIFFYQKLKKEIDSLEWTE